MNWDQLPNEQRELLLTMRWPGAMIDGFQAFLKRYIPRDAIMAEIGCFAGASTEMILEHLSGANSDLYAIDPWDSHYYKGQWDMKKVEQTFDRLLEDDLLIKLKTTSLEAARSWSYKGFPQLDAVYIDAEHDYENCRADILAWRENLKEGGVLSGHDYCEAWPGVQQAVNELCTPFTVFEDSTWVHIKGDK